MSHRVRRHLGLIAAVAIAGLVSAGAIAYVASGPTTVVVAIGDSIMEGHGLKPAQAWPQLLAAQNHWKLTNLASDGSGFVKVGNKGDTFADQARAAIELQPSIILMAGSSNDLGKPDSTLAAVTEETIATLRAALPHARIIATDAIWGASPLPAQLKKIDDQVRAALSSVNGD